MIRALLRRRLARLQRKLLDAEHRKDDKGDTLVSYSTPSNASQLEEEHTTAFWEAVGLRADIKLLEARLREPSVFWWLTKSGRYKADWHAGFDYAVEKLKTNTPDMVLQKTMALSPFESDAFHDGARAAVAEFVAKGGAK